MSERETLIELLKETKCNNDCDGFTNAEICKECKAYEKHAKSADYLLENGVIVPLVKVGDTVYQTDTAGRIYASTVKNIIYDTSSITFDERAIGTTVFLTKEEAEKALKGGAE